MTLNLIGWIVPGRHRSAKMVSLQSTNEGATHERDCNDWAGLGEESIPEVARQVLIVIADQIAEVGLKIAALEAQILAWHTSNRVSQPLATISGIDSIIASAIAAMVPDPGVFRSGREFAAWLGLVPRQNSAGGKAQLGGVNKRRDSYLRRLLVNGAHAVLLRSKAAKTDSWLVSLRARKHRLVAAVG